MLMAINEYKSEIDLETIEKAITLCDWQLRVREKYDIIDADNKIAEMEEKIRRVLKARGALKEYSIKQYTNAKRAGIWAFNQSLKNLREAGEIQLTKGKFYQYTV